MKNYYFFVPVKSVLGSSIIYYSHVITTLMKVDYLINFKRSLFRSAEPKRCGNIKFEEVNIQKRK